jgi:hypothetical protein
MRKPNGGVGLLGTAPTQEALSTCELLMAGSSFPYIEFCPKPGKARAIQIDVDPCGLDCATEAGSTWRIAPFGRFWQARDPPRYATFNQTSSPRFLHSSSERSSELINAFHSSLSRTRTPHYRRYLKRVLRSEFVQPCAVNFQGGRRQYAPVLSVTAR